MRVWIDADACPRLARDQVVKFALKRGFEVVLVAGQAVARPNFTCVKLVWCRAARTRRMIIWWSTPCPASW